MKISLIINSDFYLKNKIFDENNSIVNRDDCQRHFIDLKKACKLHKFTLNTFDITTIEESDIAFFLNTPDYNDINFKKAVSLKKICYLLINELEFIHKSNSKSILHKYFTKIFTYQDELIDNIKYFKINYSFDFNSNLSFNKYLPYEKKKLAVMIAGNKKLSHPNELYTERVKTIKWFEKNNLIDFDLYGMGWNFNKNMFNSLFRYQYKSYKGAIVEKRTILSKYKFSICYENAFGVKGWITEKIFDSLFARCVPIYWGCDAISNFVNENCYIDRNNFKNNFELYNYINNINELDYNNYINNIELYLQQVNKNNSHPFNVNYFVDTIIHQLKLDLHNEL